MTDSNQDGGEAGILGSDDANANLNQDGPSSGTFVGGRPGNKFGDADEVNAFGEVTSLLTQFLVSGNEVSQAALHDFMVQAGHSEWKSWTKYAAALRQQPRPFPPA